MSHFKFFFNIILSRIRIGVTMIVPQPEVLREKLKQDHLIRTCGLTGLKRTESYSFEFRSRSAGADSFSSLSKRWHFGWMIWPTICTHTWSLLVYPPVVIIVVVWLDFWRVHNFCDGTRLSLEPHLKTVMFIIWTGSFGILGKSP